MGKEKSKEKPRTITFENAHVHKKCTFEITGPNAAKTMIECRAPLTVAVAKKLGIEGMVFQRSSTKNNAPKPRGQQGSQKTVHSVNPKLVKTEFALELGRSKVTITPKGLEQHELHQVPCDAVKKFVVKRTDRGAVLSFELVSTMPPHAFLDYLVKAGEAPGKIELLDDEEKQVPLPGATENGEQGEPKTFGELLDAAKRAAEDETTVTLSVPGEEPVTAMTEEFREAAAQLADDDQEPVTATAGDLRAVAAAVNQEEEEKARAARIRRNASKGLPLAADDWETVH